MTLIFKQCRALSHFSTSTQSVRERKTNIVILLSLGIHNKCVKLPAAIKFIRTKESIYIKNKIQLLQDWFGTPTSPAFHGFGTNMVAVPYFAVF